ncbi:MAG: DUF6132 family protein [Elusimicrobiota bacterium]
MSRLLVSALLGGSIGFLYQRVVGCASGACPLTSNPYVATIYGAMLGLLFAAG